MIFSDVSSQGYIFMAGIFCGMVCGILYDIFRAARRLFCGGKITVLIFDLLFCLSSIALICLLFYRINGFDIKWYIILGVFGGFCIERYSLRKPIDYIAKKVYNIFYRLKSYICKKRLKSTANKEG